jgi:carbamoyltransferase
MKPEQDEFKVMGLAGYVKNFQIQDALKIFDSTYGLKNLSFIKKIKIKNHYQFFKKNLEGYRFDIIAGALQKFIENLTCQWIKRWLKKTKRKKIVFSGGLSLNIKLSQKILKIKDVKDLLIPPGGGDNSLSIGAAQYLNYKKNGIKSNFPINNAFLGKSITDKDKLIFSNHPLIKKYFICKKNTNLKVIAKLISQGKIFAFINSNAEFGPRSLGHRSILCDPRYIDIIQEINYRIKNRDFWMPFACSILDYRAKDYLINTKNSKKKYMTLSFDKKKLAQIYLKAGIHQVDKTIRPQIVYKTDCKDYYTLIENFQKYTGVGGLLNTSLNTHGKPMINNPIDLIKEMLTDKKILIDYIYIQGDMFVRKKLNINKYSII